MTKIYIPEIDESSCVIILDNNTIRVYDRIPEIRNNVAYTDYYFNSNYLYKNGVEEFAEESIIPVCIVNENITTEFWYRNDLDSILFIFSIFSIFAIYLPLKIFSRLGRRFQ